ncbi:tRNA (adenosine(37)-N6)-dimethylallyltransferase MiaA [Candidatus Saccharibacteria bacterium]|nr:tRNA (adenosine(37)-N6)-dimethylallyltransferase MiaA [Candidatus Saccharibacteria bacterium]
MKPLVVIVGETASGKSALAIDLAHRFDGELVCADSSTVYRGFDIGSAKPSNNDRKVVPHHLLDVADPSEGYNAALFKVMAQSAIADIQHRGKLPIIVGGTGLYVDSVLYDYGFLEKAKPPLRARLSAMELPALLLYADELGLDMSGIDTQNPRRVVRHIENRGVLPTRGSLRDNTVVIGLDVPRDELRQRIEHRVDSMLDDSLEAEVRTLAERYGWEVEPMKGIGYREWKPYFAGEVSRADVREEIVRDSMQLAKKQRTWFRRNNSIHWVTDPSNAVEIVTTFLNK